jgi:hypothetical protein
MRFGIRLRRSLALKDWKNAVALTLVSVALAVTGCSSKSPSVASPTGPSGLTAPTIDSPSDDQQLDTLRPTLTVRNGSGGDGLRTYDFQLADNSNFSPITMSKLSVVENDSGKTSVAIETDLNPSTRYYWRVRMVQGGSATTWSTSRFKTKVGGYNRAGELFDILSDGFTVGERFGQTSFVPGRGIRIENTSSYVRYQLPATVPNGEFSMEVEGLGPTSGTKLTVFSMAQGLGGVIGSPYEMFAQYRGTPGNPDYCITFKAVMGGPQVELNFSQRSANVVRLDPGTTYFWQGTWTQTSYRLVVRAGGPNGSVVIDTALSGGSSYSPSPHTAYIGINAGDGSFPGMIVRNVWLSSKPRPASLGSAMGPR